MSVDFGVGVETVKITVLTTNTTDMTLQTDPKFAGKVRQPGKLVANASAEHGLAMAIEVNGTHLLYDFGGLASTLTKNLEILKINPSKFHMAVLSHGHFDHFGTMMQILPLTAPGMKLFVSPDIYHEKLGFLGSAGEVLNVATLQENFRALKKEGKVAELPSIRKALIEKLVTENQLELVETKNPHQLAPGVWTSGEIELFDETELTSNLFIKLDKKTFAEDTFRDEIAIYIKVKGKGLVVLTGCGHAGIMNTIRHGQKISGIDKIYAVIGGFHLLWSSENHLDRVVDFLRKLKPEVVCGMHCTGFYFNAKMWAQLPEMLTLGVVGTTFTL